MDDDSSKPAEQAGLSGGILTGIFVVLVAAGGVFALLRSGDSAVAEVGEPAPAMVLSTFDGVEFDLADHLADGDGPVLLNLWASWCEPCLREFPALSAFASSHPEVTVIGVAVQDQEANAREFVEALQPSFLVGWDHDGSVRDAYPSFGLPATFVIGADGRVVDIILAELTPPRLDSLSFGS